MWSMLPIRHVSLAPCCTYYWCWDLSHPLLTSGNESTKRVELHDATDTMAHDVTFMNPAILDFYHVIIYTGAGHAVLGLCRPFCCRTLSI
ncbi:hypothetical protein AB205_0136350 [Aquarana catesbeiana]|uniref:Uncharacterized protein n=1 Tax=Aquarana catesbeiana TaxID=8400 RepID=A0A2G9RY60_AQUCT|nr:hypothetical protein AB205_0136350 [Aquarana catesbeiana]